MSTWNHRVVTRIENDVRLFSIYEVYYNNDETFNGYCEAKNLLKDIESLKGLKWTHKAIKNAFKKPILDLDNWPEEYNKK
jgi:hypothetical protein